MSVRLRYFHDRICSTPITFVEHLMRDWRFLLVNSRPFPLKCPLFFYISCILLHSFLYSPHLRGSSFVLHPDIMSLHNSPSLHLSKIFKFFFLHPYFRSHLLYILYILHPLHPSLLHSTKHYFILLTCVLKVLLLTDTDYKYVLSETVN